MSKPIHRLPRTFWGLSDGTTMPLLNHTGSINLEVILNFPTGVLLLDPVETLYTFRTSSPFFKKSTFWDLSTKTLKCPCQMRNFCPSLMVSPWRLLLILINSTV